MRRAHVCPADCFFVAFGVRHSLWLTAMFEHAITLDPAYAELYTVLGWTYGMEWIWQWSPNPQNLERAFELARQALALDDTLSGAHALLSWIYRRKHQPEHALAAAEQAVAFAPNYDFAYIQLAESLIDSDRPAEAVRAAEQALRLNPRAGGQLHGRLALATASGPTDASTGLRSGAAGGRFI